MDSKLIPADQDQTKRLPFEILGKIFLLLDKTPKGRIAELKKCRQVSPRWYKVVQDLFQDDFSQKLLTHYDGNNQSFALSRTFGQNLFGSYKFNFPILKISNSEFHLMKRWLGNVTTENHIQFLELKDNFLTIDDLMSILFKFRNVETIKVVQTSNDVNLTEKVRQFYKFEPNFGEVNRKIIIRSEEFQDVKLKFLKNLKSMKFEIVHPSVLNYFSYLVGDFADCKLENLSIKFDLYGLFKSAENDINIIDRKERKICIFEHLKCMSKSLKSLEITVGTNIENYDALTENCYLYFSDSTMNKVSYGISCSILDSFEYGMDFRKIQNLIVDIPQNYMRIHFDPIYFEVFVKNQRNLKNVYSGFYLGWTFNDFLPNANFTGETFRKRIKNNGKECSTFGFDISDIWPTILTQLTEYLSVVHIQLEYFSTWRFSNDRVPIFPNCKEMEIKVYHVREQLWPDFEVPEIFRKFPNLEILKIRRIEFDQDGHHYARISPQINHNDIQFILQNYTNLKHLYLANCFDRFSISSSTFTGLSPEARVNHLNNPDLAVKPEEFEGFPISNLKKLEVLVLKDSFGGLLRVTDSTALFGFGQMPELKYLEIRDTEITKEGFSIIREKSGSKDMKIPYLGKNEWSHYTRYSGLIWQVTEPGD